MRKINPREFPSATSRKACGINRRIILNEGRPRNTGVQALEKHPGAPAMA
ncbi:MAG: hypothetical protein WCK47_09575 [bacterium]|nr:hypothetical protein [Candidatus Sumerlaeota bacterium]